MINLLTYLAETIISLLKPRQELFLENLALRQQIMILKRSAKRPHLTKSDRLFWVVLLKIWSRWSEVLQLVKPEIVVRWYRESFRHYWAWKSREPRSGRPSIDAKVRELFRDMSRANPLWGAPRIHGELLKLDIHASQASVSKYMIRKRKPPLQSWRAFLDNHIQDLVSIDFLTVPTATFRVLFVFIVFSHDRRRVIHFNVTEHPTAQWTVQQIIEAFPFVTAPKYLLRDRDGIYGFDFQRRVASMGIEQVLTALRSPWQNAYVKLGIGSICHECLDHIIILNETHVYRIFRSYFFYYHGCRTHLSLNKDTPEPRDLESHSMGEVIALPQVGGLHHWYTRRAT